MSHEYRRRRFLLHAGAGAAALTVLGFDPVARRWIGTAEAAPEAFAATPALDGTLLMDNHSRASASRDQGNIVTRHPSAVLRPGSVADIATMIRYCAKHGIGVSARGAAHTVFGQGLGSGLVIEMRALNRIHSVDTRGADVDAGVLWRDLVVTAYHRVRATPPVLTGSVDLTIGGTLSVGGVDGNFGHFRRGLQIDNVMELEVVTGAGEIVRCSPHRHRDLFEATLGGLGQFGIITRAVVNMAPVPPMVRVYRIHYTDNHRFFTDFRTLLNRGELDGIYNLWMPNGTALVYELTACVHFDPARPPDDRHLLRGLGAEAAITVTLDLPYLTAAQFLDDILIAPMKQALSWDRLVKPWFDAWLPDDTVEQFVADVASTLQPDDIGLGGFFLVIPQKRAALTRPFFRVPQGASSDWIYLVDLLTASPTPGPDPRFAAAKVARNRRLYDKAVAAGGTRYPISAVEFTPEDWKRHYGATWPRFSALKRRFDPRGILTSGVGLF